MTIVGVKYTLDRPTLLLLLKADDRINGGLRMVARKGGLADNLGKLMLGLLHRGSREHVGLCYVIPVRQNYKHSPTATNGHLIYLFI